jgi:hypothetical protein
VRLRFREPCAKGGYVNSNITLGLLRLRGGRFSRRNRFRDTIGGGLTTIDSYRLSGRFFYRNGYRVRARWRVRTIVLRKGRRLDTCSRSAVLRGRFRGGPVGVEGPHPKG